MKSPARQYTVRHIPEEVDRTLRRRAKETGKSFNQVALEALVAGAGAQLRPERDLRDVVGSLSAKEAAAMDREVEAQRQIDPKLWR